MNSARYRHFYNNLPPIAIPERPFFPEKSHFSEIFLQKPQILCGAAANCRLFCRPGRQCRLFCQSASQAVDHRPTGARTPAHESAAHSGGGRCRLRWGYWGHLRCRECRVRRRAVVYVLFRLAREAAVCAGSGPEKKTGGDVARPRPVQLSAVSREAAIRIQPEHRVSARRMP